MKRLLKWLFGLIGAVLLLLVVAAVAAMLFIDPNDYRDTIAGQVKEQTGRDLTIEGDIKLSLFPWLGLELGAMELGNAEGFGDQPMARITAAEARVKLLPLFKLQTEIDTVLLRGLELNLQRGVNGESNWDDLAKGDVADEQPEQAAAPADPQKLKQILESLAIGGIILEDANVEWRDDVNQQRFSLNNLNFRSGEIRIAQAIPLKLSAELSSSAPKMEGALEFDGNVTADPLAQRYGIEGMALRAKLSGEPIPGGKLEASLGGGVAVNLAEQSLRVSPLKLSVLGMEVKLNAEGKQIIDKPAFSGDLAIKEFVPRQLLADLGISLPEMADPSVMGKANLSTRFQADLNSVALNELALRLDDTTFGGKASVRNIAAPVIRYTLKLDEIDVDRYLPPPSEQPASEEAATPATAAAPDLPLELMRSLDIDGSFTVDKVKVMNLRSDTIVTTLKAKGGKFRLHPLSANMYQGSYSGNIGFDVSGETPRLSMDEKLSGVQAGPLLKDFMGKPYATGEASFAANLTANGLDPMSVRKSLNGSGNFSFNNGTVNGVNIGQLIRNAYAAYKKQPKPAEEEKSTDFANLSGSFKMVNGLLTISDLSADSPVLQVAGKGKVNLVSEKLDMRLDTTLLHDDKDIAAGGAAELKGQVIPITIKGAFSDPKFGVDIASILEAKAKAVVEKKKEEVREEVEQQVEKKKKRLQREVEDKLKDMIRF